MAGSKSAIPNSEIPAGGAGTHLISRESLESYLRCKTKASVSSARYAVARSCPRNAIHIEDERPALHCHNDVRHRVPVTVSVTRPLPVGQLTPSAGSRPGSHCPSLSPQIPPLACWCGFVAICWQVRAHCWRQRSWGRSG